MLHLPDAKRGSIIRASSFIFSERGGVSLAEPVGPALGATQVRLQVVRVAAGGRWHELETQLEENVVVVFAGGGTGQIDDQERSLERASAMYSPTGSQVSFVASSFGATLYVWRSKLLPGRKRSASPKLFGSLWDSETQLRGFTGTGQVAADVKTATMNFIFWPGVGCSQLCLHCGVMEPGETFNVHVHPESDEAFIAFQGEGQLFLYDRWHDAAAGDVLFAPPGVPHGTRNTSASRFVTCGGPTPFDPVLYERAGVATVVR
jgi:quercetin dioxygenase-like cupin family protein